MRVDVDRFIVKVGQGLQGDQKRERCRPIARVNVLVVALPMGQIIPVKKLSDDLGRLFQHRSCHHSRLAGTQILLMDLSGATLASGHIPHMQHADRVTDPRSPVSRWLAAAP